MKKHICISIILTAFLGIANTFAQENAQQLKQAQELQKRYQFDKAIDIYNSILGQRPDSTLSTEADTIYNMKVKKMAIESENGKNMLKFASIPQLISKQAFPLKSFFLNYPGFDNGQWIAPPKEYTPDTQDNPVNVMYMSNGNNSIIFSAKDESGVWNLMSSGKLNDSLWSVPKILNENITTSGNEILPHLSPDGKTLYFASNGHSGMGGYDLYMSKWNEETDDWDIAQNLGFPYSSTANDYMYHNTPDGFFTLFSSDRETSETEVTTYITRYEVLPLKQEIQQEDAPKYATFSIKSATTAVTSQAVKENKTAPEEKEYENYNRVALELKNVEAQLSAANEKINAARYEYSMCQDSLKRLSIEENIREQEGWIITLSEDANEIAGKLQAIELELISKGIEIPQQLQAMGLNENTVATTEPSAPKFLFANNKTGVAPIFQFEVIEPEVDLSFKITDASTITDLAELPDGLVYHIQLMTTTKKATPKSFKGLTPIFERRVSSGKYTYSAGVFPTYAEAQKNLAKVKKRGFTTAMITAYNNGKSISTKEARVVETQDNSMYRVTIGGYSTLPPEAVETIRKATNKDIAKVNINGVMKFVIGPFGNKMEAEALANALKARQVTAVEMEKLENN